MVKVKKILDRIKSSVLGNEPNATIIFFGSYARGDNRKDSDIDLLILLDKDSISRNEKKKIKYPLYELEIETGKLISPFVLSKKDWQTRHKITPFYENVLKEGKVL